MESLDDTFGPPIPVGSRRTRLLIGAAILLGGVPIATVQLYELLLKQFGASMGPAAAQQTAIALSALFVPTVFAISLLRLPASRGVRLAAVGGVVLDTLVAALFLIVVPAAMVVAIPGWITIVYGIGAVVAIGAPLATIVAALYRGDETSRPTMRIASSTTGSASKERTGMPTDGGRARDRLNFLLDDEQ
jgi:hypothetical protein